MMPKQVIVNLLSASDRSYVVNPDGPETGPEWSLLCRLYTYSLSNKMKRIIAIVQNTRDIVNMTKSPVVEKNLTLELSYTPSSVRSEI